MRYFLTRTLPSVRTLLASAVALLLVLSLSNPLQAQVPSVAPPPFQPSTFMASVNLAAPQTGAGDLFCVVGSATRLIKIKSLRVTGVKTTAEAPRFALVKRSAANTGGTSTAPVGVPLDSTQTVLAATATVAAYTVVPTPGAAVGTISIRYQGFAAAASQSGIDWTWPVQSLLSEPRLRGVAQSLCLNAPAAFTTDGPTLGIEVTWTEQ